MSMSGKVMLDEHLSYHVYETQCIILKLLDDRQFVGHYIKITYIHAFILLLTLILVILVDDILGAFYMMAI